MKPSPSERRAAQAEQAAAVAAQAAHEAEMDRIRIELHAAGAGFVAAWDTLTRVIGRHMAMQGFNKKEFGTDIALMHSELSESLEADRAGALDDKLPQSEGRAVELADCVIRIMHAQDKYSLESIGSLVIQKHLYNTTRPYKHGKGY